MHYVIGSFKTPENFDHSYLKKDKYFERQYNNRCLEYCFKQYFIITMSVHGPDKKINLRTLNFQNFIKGPQ